MNDKMVAILISNPISDIKNNKIVIVPNVNNTIQIMYPLLKLLLNNSWEVLCIALGEASKVVIVVLNIVVKAAIAINMYENSPKFLVYNLISWEAKTPPLLEKVSPDLYITKAPKRTKQIPKKSVLI